MGYYYGGESPLGLIVVLLVFVFSMFAQSNINSTYRKYSQIRSGRGITGRDAARNILDSSGLYHVGVVRIEGNLTDHYDPRANEVRLSAAVYDQPTISSVGIAAHECGHAIQHANNYVPMQLRSAIVPITNIGSKLAIPILLVGFLLSSSLLINIGIIGYALMAVFQLVTLPVEFNASSRALAVIGQQHLLESEEHKGAARVLRAAALTYVAALASALAQLLRLVLMANRRRR